MRPSGRTVYGIDDPSHVSSTEQEPPSEPPEPDSDATSEEPNPPRRSRTGKVLLASAGLIWAAWGITRCMPRPQGAPSLATTSDQAEPAAVETPDPASEPATEAAAEEPDPATATPPTEPVGRTWIDPAWAAALELPTEFTYSVRRGGSLKNVANLFKIFYHEIQALNPGIELERPLDPGTKIVVARRKSGSASESVGYPSAGSLEGSVPLPEGPGRKILAIPWKTWATATTITTIDRALRTWKERQPNAHPILVGNLSAPKGGKLEPHSTHQSGRDADLGYPQKLEAGAELNWQTMTATNLDVARTWALLQILVETGGVEVVYIDRSIQKLLHEHATAQGTPTKTELRRWLEYPRATGSARTIVQHVPGHTDHLHVRIACPPAQKRCKSR